MAHPLVEGVDQPWNFSDTQEITRRNACRNGVPANGVKTSASAGCRPAASPPDEDRRLLRRIKTGGFTPSAEGWWAI